LKRSSAARSQAPRTDCKTEQIDMLPWYIYISQIARSCRRPNISWLPEGLSIATGVEDGVVRTIGRQARTPGSISLDCCQKG
jgi:hypothetical protein